MGVSSETSNNETFLVGLIGLILFSFLFFLSLINYYYTKKNITKFFFFFFILMSILELPQYFIMILTLNYHSLWGYSCHILASYLFFLSLSIVILIWSVLLELDVITLVLYSKNGILLIDILLGGVAIVTMIFCLNATSLKSFFNSVIYEIYIFIECFSVLAYTGIIAIYGIKLVLRSITIPSLILLYSLALTLSLSLITFSLLPHYFNFSQSLDLEIILKVVMKVKFNLYNSFKMQLQEFVSFNSFLFSFMKN